MTPSSSDAKRMQTRGRRVALGGACNGGGEAGGRAHTGWLRLVLCCSLLLQVGVECSEAGVLQQARRVALTPPWTVGSLRGRLSSWIEGGSSWALLVGRGSVERFRSSPWQQSGGCGDNDRPSRCPHAARLLLATMPPAPCCVRQGAPCDAPIAAVSRAKLLLASARYQSGPGDWPMFVETDAMVWRPLYGAFLAVGTMFLML